MLLSQLTLSPAVQPQRLTLRPPLPPPSHPFIPAPARQALQASVSALKSKAPQRDAGNVFDSYQCSTSPQHPHPRLLQTPASPWSWLTSPAISRPPLNTSAPYDSPCSISSLFCFPTFFCAGPRVFRPQPDAVLGCNVSRAACDLRGENLRSKFQV